MTTYLAQYRLVKLNDRGEPDEWSSARSTMTVTESSIPVKADTDDVAVRYGAKTMTELLGQQPHMPFRERTTVVGMQEASDVMVAGAGSDETGYNSLAEPMAAQAILADDVLVAAVVYGQTGEPSVSIIFIKDTKALPGLALLGPKARKLMSLIDIALKGAEKFVADTWRERPV